jgi:hypothetical protein
VGGSQAHAGKSRGGSRGKRERRPASGGARHALAIIAGVALAGGCAYSFTGSNLPSYVKTIAIPNFANETLQPGLDQEITTAVIDRFIKDGRLKMAPEGKASCRLAGRLVKYENRVYNYAPDQTPKDYVVVVTAAVTMKDMIKNRDLG